MSKIRKNTTVVVVLCLFASSLIADKLKTTVHVIDRKNSQTAYSAVIPGRSTSNTTGNANCYGSSSTVNCYGSSNTNTVSTPPRKIGYSVTGATLSLQLPDGRIAVVNCASKYKLRGDYVNKRDCRAPLMDDFDVEFDGDKAKLIWPVSLDGKKKESETYKLLGVFPPE